MAAIFDSIFVIIQRYNRPRLIKLIEKRDLIHYSATKELQKHS
ncbi:hypothetical protein [Defluviitalea saccharophila]